MKKKMILQLLILLILSTFLFCASSSVLPKEERFSAALQGLEDYLNDDYEFTTLEEIYATFENLGNYDYAYYYALYTKVLICISNNDFQNAMQTLEDIRLSEDFCAMLDAQKSQYLENHKKCPIGTVVELEYYALAKQAEFNRNIYAAIEYYGLCSSFMDSMICRNNLAATVTPTPIPTPTPTPAPTPTPTPAPTARIYREGDIIQFGEYEQDSNYENGKEPIEWRILKVYDRHAFIITEKALESKCYHDKQAYIDWMNSSLRNWLNLDFYNNSFSREEQQRIIFTSNPDTNSNEYIFILNYDEAQTYFASNNARIAIPTQSALDHGAWKDNNGGSWWWIRSSDTKKNAPYISSSGRISSSKNYVNDSAGTVRPAMWIMLP